MSAALGHGLVLAVGPTYHGGLGSPPRIEAISETCPLITKPDLQSLCAVRRDDIRLGEPLPFSIYNAHGLLLLKAGFTLKLQRQLDVVLKNGAFVSSAPATEPDAEIIPHLDRTANNSFEMVDFLKLRLQRIFDHYRHGDLLHEFLPRIEDVALSVREACASDADAALANMYIDYESSYAVVHHVQVAMVCELIGKEVGMSDELRHIVVQAALTHDLALLGMQSMLERHTEALTPDQADLIRAHPAHGTALLRQVGVVDPVWLGIVRHHHERLDGSGYPDRLAGRQLTLPTRLLAVADVYSALVRDRPYRRALPSRMALRSLLMERAAKIDQGLCQRLLKVVGVMPPGSIVRLADGRIAVVKKRRSDQAAPFVYAFVRADGSTMLRPQRCDTAQVEHAIVEALPFSEYRGCISLIRGLWFQGAD